jgi:type VI secretion system protein ImpL
LLLLLLERYRTKRPIDGIFIAISAEELYGDSKLEHNEILGRAKQLYEKLANSQDILGMRVPVYIIITKSDTIEGFKEFAQCIPAAHKQQMLGWSNDHGVRDPFETNWIDQAYQSLAQSIDRIRMEIFTAAVDDQAKEKVFGFSAQLMKTRELLSIYLSNIFKFSSYRDPFLLRGIYFVGEGDPLPQVQDASQETNPFPKMSALKIERLHEDENPLCFVRDFLTQKAFREYGLAEPIPSRQKSDYRSMMVSRAAILTMILMCGVGSVHDHSSLSNLQKELLPVLYQIQQILVVENEEIKNPKEHAEKIALQTQLLLKFMSQMHETSFFKAFLPPSWFSNLNDTIGKTLALGYEQIIAKSVQDQFSSHFHKIIEGKLAPRTRPDDGSAQRNDGHNPLNTPQTNALSPHSPAGSGEAGKLLSALTGQAPQFDPIQVSEFQELQIFVDQVIEFEVFLNKYNALIDSADQSKLSEVTEYLFGFSLPKESLEYLRKFKTSKHFSGHRQIDVMTYTQEARRVLKKKYLKYFKAVLEFGPNYAPIIALAEDLRKFTSEPHENLDNIQLANLYRNVSHSISNAVEFMNLPTLDWIEASVFNPGEAYAALLMRLSEHSTLLGAQAAGDLMKDAAPIFDLFKKKAMLMASPVSGVFFSTANGQLQSQPSESLNALKSILSDFFGQPFMGLVGDGTFLTTFEDDKRLMWDTNSLSKAVAIAESFDSFLNDKLQKYPKELRETLRIMGAEHLERHVNYQLKQAQSFVNAPHMVGVAALEEQLRSVVPNLKVAIPYLTKLLETLSQTSSAQTFLKLRELCVNEATALLLTADKLLDEEKLYTFSDGNFDWWDGKPGGAYHAYSAKDNEDLAKYFDVQRARVSMLSKDFAEVLVGFLQMNILKSADQNLTLISRWNRISAQLLSYDKKKPDNTIISLENYIHEDLNQLTYTTCFDKINESDILEHTGDYFEQKKLDLKKAVYAKCQKTSFEATTKLYGKIAEAFNGNLAGKFPFVSPQSVRQAGSAAQEADPQDIRDFLTLAQDVTPGMLYALKNDKRFSHTKVRVINFLKKVSEMKDLFGPFLKGDPGQDVPTFVVGAEFRINQEKEIGANQIIEYDAEFSDGQVISMNDTGKTVNWKYGTPITITMKWAESGSSLPSSDPRQPVLSAHGYAANFYFSNQWSLFMALFSHAAQQGDFDSNGDTAPHVLRFDIPVTENTPDGSFPTSAATKPTRLFARLTVAVPDQGGNKAVKISSFPIFAPSLEVNEEENEADHLNASSSDDDKSDEDDMNLKLPGSDSDEHSDDENEDDGSGE